MIHKIFSVIRINHSGEIKYLLLTFMITKYTNVQNYFQINETAGHVIQYLIWVTYPLR